MAVYSPVNKNELEIFLEQYDIGTLLKFDGILEGIENTNYKIITTQNTYILTIFEKRVDEEDLPFFINLKNHLVKKNFLCPKPISSKTGKVINHLNKKPCILISYLKGKKVLDILLLESRKSKKSFLDERLRKVLVKSFPTISFLTFNVLGVIHVFDLKKYIKRKPTKTKKQKNKKIFFIFLFVFFVY